MTKKFVEIIKRLHGLWLFYWH